MPAANGNGPTSVIGVIQSTATATAENLEHTAAGIRGFEEPLRKAMAHTDAAMGETHQGDVGELQGIVQASIAALGAGADQVAACGGRVREVEARL